MPLLQQLGMQAASNAVGGIMGLALGSINDKRQLKQQGKLQKQQIAGNKEMIDYQMAKELQMWQNTNYGPQMEQLKKAGLNPGLIYGMSGGGGATTGNATASVQGTSAPQGGREIQDMVGMGMQMQLLQAQKEVLQTQAEKNRADAAKTAGVDTANVQADTENKILQKIITEYTGKEAKDIYEQVSSPNRQIQAKTYQDELEARQGVAGNIYELWTEGKLKDKSIAEIEQILLGNAKSRAEKAKIMSEIDLLDQNIKGAQLDNIIRELETRLQTQTGIDRNSPAWMKVLGRLFVQLFNK